MRKFLIFNRQRLTVGLFYWFCIFLIILVSGCGDESHDNLSSESSDTASASFTVEWHDTPTVQSSENTLIAASLDCEDAGVSTVTCEVYEVDGGSRTHLTSGGPWQCSLGTGTINNISAGTGRAFVVLGEGAGGILYHGETTGWTITAGQTTNVGTIDAYFFVPTGLAARAESSSQINLSWISPAGNAGVIGYKVYRDGSYLKSVTSTSTSDTGRSADTQYCYTVAAYDAGGNESAQSDQDCATTLESFVWYRDADGDGYGDRNDSINSETQPEDYVSDNTDCNDNDRNIYPGATETCNGIDDDCDGSIDEGVLNTYYRDADGDEYGNASNTTQACTRPSGYVTDSSDCNDNDGSIHPGATEICDDGVDQDCDGAIDCSDPDCSGDPACQICTDADSDGY